jgi:hypothetical protein
MLCSLSFFSPRFRRILQGKNLFGKIGLFPQSYTTEDPNESQSQPTPQAGDQPVPSGFPEPHLQNVNEEKNSTTATPNGKQSTESNEGVMRATMTDVQEAIEQLGRSNRDGNGSFTFSSTHATDTDRETDTEGGMQSNDENTEAWHKGARSNLAEKARMQQELLRKEQEAYDEELRRHAPILNDHEPAPPISFELSDESEDEHEPDLSTDAPFGHREHDHISEVDEDEDQVPLQLLRENGRPTTPKIAKSQADRSRTDLSSPRSFNSIIEPPPETARQTSFTAAQPKAMTSSPSVNGTSSPKAFQPVVESPLRVSILFFWKYTSGH